MAMEKTNLPRNFPADQPRATDQQIPWGQAKVFQSGGSSDYRSVYPYGHHSAYIYRAKQILATRGTDVDSTHTKKQRVNSEPRKAILNIAVVDIAKHSQVSTSEWRHVCNNTSRQWVKYAPLGPPSAGIVRHAMLASWTVLIVETAGTPETWRLDFEKLWADLARAASQAPPNLLFLDRHMQQQLGFYSGQCSDSHSGSKNVGSLFAIKCGADIIVEAEEDLGVEQAAELAVQAADIGPFPQALGDPTTRLINPYALYGRPEIFPRGFPQAAASKATFEFRKVQHVPEEASTHRPLMQSLLVDPTTAAVPGSAAAPTHGSQQMYSKPNAVAAAPGYFMPVPLGSTAYASDAFWGLALLDMPQETSLPAWRSLWVQKLLWGVGGQLLLLAPSLCQNRTGQAVHTEALVGEEEDAAGTYAMVQFLHHWECSEQQLDMRILKLARDSRDKGFWSQAVVDKFAAWVADLRAVGYVFPRLQAAERLAATPLKAPRKMKLAALCFTGEADRSPEAITNTLSHMRRLLRARNTSLEALQLAKSLEHSRTDDDGVVFAHDTFAYVSTHGSCSDHVRWVAQHGFTYSILYNDPVLKVPYPLNQKRFYSNNIDSMLHQMHAQQRCFEMVQEYSRQHALKYSVIVRLRTDHQFKSLASDTSSFALWHARSLASVVIPQPEWDFSDLMWTGGYQDRIGWGPPKYMQFYMRRWSQFFNKTHMESDAPFHGESSLRYALTTFGAPVERVDDDQLQYLEIAHNKVDCATQESRRTYD